MNPSSHSWTMRKQVERYAEKGFCRAMPLEAVHQRFPQETASKLAVILKQKPDGSTKGRIVIDLRRSQGNQRAKVKERIVLPQAQDIVTSLRVMRAREHELTWSYEDDQMEFCLIDL